MDVDAYLDRIGLSARPAATLAGLTALHRAHLRAIPYEDLDVQLKRPVTIERPAIFEKIVTRGRGGWCYEMNGLFGWALGELGFEVTRVIGAVGVSQDNPELNIGNHLVLTVALDGETYVADVGLSGGPLDPIKLGEGPFSVAGYDYRMERLGTGWWRFHNDPRCGPPNFDFHPDPADESVLATRCAQLQSEDWSPFVQNLICTRFIDGGSVVLLGRFLRTITLAGRAERVVDSADELVGVLKDDFRIDVPEAASLWPQVCERHEVVLARQAEAAAGAGASGS